VARDVPDGSRDRAAPGPRAAVAGARATTVALAVAATGALCVLLAGCGGGDDLGPAHSTSASTPTNSERGSEQQAAGRRDLKRARREEKRLLNQLQPPSTSELLHNEVKLVLTSTKPLACQEPFPVTERFLQEAYGGHEGCVRSRTPGSVADSVDFKNLRVEGDRATAVVVPSGGPYDGERITVSLVRGGPWAVDGLRSNVPVGP
jgi:hypothetical protein